MTDILSKHYRTSFRFGFEYPMLFNVAAIEDGLFDLMKYQDFNPSLSMYPSHLHGRTQVESEIKNAWKYSTWYEEFYCMLESEEEFRRLLELSPLHNIAKNSTANISTYPAVLCLTGKR